MNFKWLSEKTRKPIKNLYVTLPEIKRAKDVYSLENLDIVVTEDNIGIIWFHACTSDVKENLYQNADQLRYGGL